MKRGKGVKIERKFIKEKKGRRKKEVKGKVLKRLMIFTSQTTKHT